MFGVPRGTWGRGPSGAITDYVRPTMQRRVAVYLKKNGNKRRPFLLPLYTSTMCVLIETLL